MLRLCCSPSSLSATAPHRVSPIAYCPSWIDPIRAFHGLQLFKHCSKMDLYLKACSSGANWSNDSTHGRQFPQPSCPTTAPLHGLQLQPGVLLWEYPWAVPPPDLIHCCPMGYSVAAWGDLPCAVPMACRGMACSSTGLSWAAGSCCSSLELLLPSSCTNQYLQGYFSPISHSLSQLLLCSIISFFKCALQELQWASFIISTLANSGSLLGQLDLTHI